MRQWKHIGIFVSSTFKDMDVERDALRTLVEPKVNKYLEKYMLSIEFIDLRHSVKTDKNFNEAERERQICSVCFREIDRSAPYFIGLLGHRYGWIPPEGIIENESVNVFPIDDRLLSVTAHEYIRGLFADQQSARGCVFVRNESSYRNLNSESLSDFVEDGANRLLLEKVRKYLLENNDIQTVDYSIDLGNASSSAIAEWVGLAYDTVLELLEPECRLSDNEDELSEFIYQQERYVQNKIKNFKGRQSELNEFYEKLEKRNGCILSGKEFGIGMHSFLCVAYVRYRQDVNKVCLFYSSESTTGHIDFNKVLCYWTILLCREYLNEDMPFNCNENDEALVKSKFKECVDVLIAQGKNVYTFICDHLPNVPEVLYSTKLIHLCVYSDEVSMLRPLMYMLEPYRKETIAQIVEPLRPQVRSRLMSHPRSRYAKWLEQAVMQLDRLDKMDFLSIRNNPETDNESGIVKYQLSMIDEFPNDVDEMMLRWYEKVCNFLGHTLITKIIYAVGIIEDGVPATLCSDIVGCSLSEFTIACHALGEDIISENANGLWGLTDRDALFAAIEQISTSDKDLMLARMLSYVESSHCLQKPILKIYMLARDVEGFMRLLESYNNSVELYNSSYIHDLSWMATFLPYDLKSFFVSMTQSAKTVSYQFIYNLILCVKRLNRSSILEVYAGILNLIRNWMASLWTRGKIDAKTYSLYGDVLACEADYHLFLKNYREGLTALEYGMTLSKDMMKKEPLWAKSYLYFIYRKVRILNPDYRFEVLKTSFVPLERQNRIVIPEGDDKTLYAILLAETFKYYIANGNYSVSDMAVKAVDMFADILDKRMSNLIETVLKPVDVIRNLLYNLYVVLCVDDNASNKLLADSWCLNKGWEIIRKCEPMKESFSSDSAFYCYYAIIGKLIMRSSSGADVKIADLYRHIFDVIGERHCKFITYIVISRNEKTVSNNFAAYISLMSVVLHLLAHADRYSCPMPKFVSDKQTEGFENNMKRNSCLEFSDELRNLLPLIGVKVRNDDGLMPDLLKDSMIKIYESMINVELAKTNPDEEIINKLYNSCVAEIQESDLGNVLPYSITVADRSQLIEILNKYQYDNSLYDDYSDGLGLEADIFSCEKGMWANGDPELAFQLEIITVPGEYTWSRQELEKRIKNSDYDSIISEFADKRKISAHEAYYLGLALMRTGAYEHAYNVMCALIDTELSEEILSDGQVFSVITNYLIACLLSCHFEDYIDLYTRINPEFHEDEDIIEVHNAYLKCVEDGSHEVVLNTPYGYMI